MEHQAIEEHRSPTLLIVNDEQQKLTVNSAILAALNQVSVPILSANEILAWIQQYQPDLIVLDLELSQIINLQLITALRVDWLTRNIPIMLLATATQQLQFKEKLDYDLCLTKPYSTVDLEKAICSLLSIPACIIYGKAV